MAASKNTPDDAVEEEDAYVFVFDRREKAVPEFKISTGGLFSYLDFKQRVKDVLQIGKNEAFVISTTNREEIKDDPTWDIIDKGETLYVLRHINQELCAPAEEKVTYLPHYDTIVKGGMYEYYASEGQNPLPYAFAELIDNSLAATANNPASRHIEIRLHFEESSIYVIDNGKGMSPRQLNNWAIYRLSKFIRKDKRSKVNLDETVEEEESFLDHSLPKSLNSDISYFGVGGKQAVFFIGDSCKMITRAKGSKDIHELTISKDEFEKKEKNHEAIYSGFIKNRKAGDASHIPEEEDVLRDIIEREEPKMDSFTLVLIQGISKDHLQYLRERMKEWTRQLSHIYHYYLHGPYGNAVDDDGAGRTPSPFRHIEIQVKLWFNKSLTVPRLISLREIEEDMQTLFVRCSVDSFEFRAHVEGALVEGTLRYHPFLYDRETYPMDIYEKVEVTIEDEHDYAISDTPARGRRAIFECYWNGRLIPYTTIDSFDWCMPPKKSKTLAVECFNRVSGVLWTDDSFQVSTNKLTFMDLELKLRDKQTVFARVVNGQEKRTSIEKEFINWLKECHELHDKQIHFTKFDGPVVRSDLPKQKQTPWAAFKQVEWDGKIFKEGQMVRVLRTVPVLLGSIKRILLYGDHSGDVYATGGDLEIIQEPRSIYHETKIVPLSKLDRSAGIGLIRKYIEDEETKLPSAIEITWPEGNPVSNNEKRRAGKPIGDIRAEILNKKGDKITKMPGKDHAAKRLLVELKVIWHSSDGDQTIVSHISQHGKTWPYWFRKMENVKNLGSYTLKLQVVLNEVGENTFSGKTLPCMKINFSVIEAEAEKFSVGILEGPFRVAVPFNIPLDLQDSFGNQAKAVGLALKPRLEANGVELTFAGTLYRGHTVTIKDVVAKTQVNTAAGKSFSLNIKVPELNEAQHTMKIRLLPGPPASIEVTPEGEQVVENGKCPVFNIQLQDAAGNATGLEGRQSVVCKLFGAPGLPSYSLECSSTGSGTITGEPVLVKKMKSEVILTAKIDIQGSKVIKTVERKIKVVPSGKTSEMRLFYANLDMKEPKQIQQGEELERPAGEMLEGLSFKLYDEADRVVKLDDKIVSKIKVNWTAKVPKEQALRGYLPSIKTNPSTTEHKYCQISMADNSGLVFDFVLRAIPGEPSALKCTCCGGNSISIGQTLPGDIIVKVKDRFGNDITHGSDKAWKYLKVTGEKLGQYKVSLDKSLKDLVIKGIVFEGGTLGPRELQITWNNLKDYLRLMVVAGPPAKIQLVGMEENEELVVYSESKMPKPLVVQLLDSGGNPCKKADIRVQLTKDTKFKIIPSPLPVKTNKDGTADFGTFTMACPLGTYEIQPHAYISQGLSVSGPKIKVIVKADPTRPNSLNVSYNNKAAFIAGGPMTEFKVSIFAEDGAPLATAKASHVSLKLWPSEGPDHNSLPSRTLSYNPESGKRSEPGMFHFKNVRVPEEVGAYNIMFVFYDGKHQLFSNVIHVKIEPSVPVTFVAVDDPGTAAVSNTRQYAARCIVRNLKLELRDKYNNHVTKGMNGSVAVEILSPSGEKDMPQLVGTDKHKCLNLTLAGGTCSIQNITITENSPGKDGCEYQLQCTVKCNIIPKSGDVQPYIIPFLFYNDAKKQSEMAALSKERDNLQNAIKTYKSLFETTEQLIEELKFSVKEAQVAETKIRQELRGLDVGGVQTNSVESIDKLIKDQEEKKDCLFNKKRRMCSLQTIMPNDPEVLGKIGHLAQIGDDDAARVLSWHMSSDMDCVVTMTTKKAKEIYSQTNGRQQVLPLDSIFRKSLTDWDKPLPHMKYKPNWRPPGKLMYARKLLTFRQNTDKCQTVFSMLLGDTLWIDTLDQANDYRRELVKYTNCPTILTREGDRIRSNGKFGGLMNKAPPIEKLRGAIFGAPLPDDYHKLCSILDTLRNLQSAVMVHKTARDELKEQTETITAPEMKAKYDECREVEKQLRDIETKLGVVSSARTPLITKDVRRTPDLNDGPAAKKLKLSPAVTEVNGTGLTTFNTPVRQSRRIAAKTPETENPKKLKKS